MKNYITILVLVLTTILASCTSNETTSNNLPISESKDSLAVSDTLSLVYRNSNLCLLSKGNVIKKVNVVYEDSLQEFVNLKKYVFAKFKKKKAVLFEKSNLSFHFPIDTMMARNYGKINFVDDVKVDDKGDTLVFLIKYLSTTNVSDSLIYKFPN